MPLLGGTLVPLPDVVLPVTIDASGRAAFGLTQPGPLPPGTRRHAQSRIVDIGGPFGLAVSNALVAVSP